jgi:hypothetical protein
MSEMPPPSIPPPDDGQAPPSTAPTDDKGMKTWVKVVLGVVGAFVLIGVLGAIFGGDDEDDAGSNTTVETTDEAEAEETTPATVETTPDATDPIETVPVETAPSETAAPVTEAPTTEAPTTTAAPTTTSSTVPVIEDGVYLVGSEVAPGVYRVGRYWARLDASQEIIDNDLTDDCPSIVNILPTDTFIEITGQATPVDLTQPWSPFELDCQDGTFLVGLDIQVGRYRITPEAGGTAYWARLDANREIIDNNLSEGQLIVDVQDGDAMLTFSGIIEAM